MNNILSYVNQNNKTVKGAAAFEHFVKESGYDYQQILDLIERDKIDTICIIDLNKT